MITKIQFMKWVLILSMLFTGALLKAEARLGIQDVLSTGGTWILTVDGERDDLVIRGSKSEKSKNGGYTLNSRVVWAGHSGVLKAVSDGRNASQFVTLQLTRSNGSKISCRGYIAQEDAIFMAGNCGSKKAPGAWYAVSGDSTLSSSQSAKNNCGTYGKRLHSCESSEDQLTKSNSELNKKYLAANKLKQRCQSSLKRCYQENIDTSSSLSKKSFSSFKNKIDGHYYTAGEGGDNADTQVQRIDISERPGSGSDLDNFLRQHNNALLGLTDGVLDKYDRDRYSGQERQKCRGNIYCEMALRQQVISCALDIGC